MAMVDEGIWRHYKGNLYRVICTARHTESEEALVIYIDVTDEEKVWARPASMWHETVVYQNESQPRFRYLARDMDELDTKPLFTLIEDITEHMQLGSFGEDKYDAYYERATGEIISVLNSIMGAYEDGDVMSEFDPEDADNAMRISENPDDFIRLPDGDDLDEYELMEEFADNAQINARYDLQHAVKGKGAFRRFKDTAERFVLLDDWHSFNDAAYRKEAREWCDDNGIIWSVKMIK